MKVLNVKPYPSEKNPEAGYVDVQDASGVFNAWTPKVTALKVGEDVPEGWERKDSDKGPRLLPPGPKGQGGQSAYRNTKEGSTAEQERMDRRTALMQAVALDSGGVAQHWTWVDAADQMYAWLRKTSGSGGLPEKTGEAQVRLSKPAPDPGTTSAPPLRNGPSPSDGAEPGAEGRAQPGGEGRGKPNPPSLEQWPQEALDIGLTRSKAVIMARRMGWDGINSAEDIHAEQLEAMIKIRKEELQ